MKLLITEEDLNAYLAKIKRPGEDSLVGVWADHSTPIKHSLIKYIFIPFYYFTQGLKANKGCILAASDQRIHVGEFTNLTNLTTPSKTFDIALTDVATCKIRSGVIFFRVDFELNDGSKQSFQILRKTLGHPTHSERTQALLAKLQKLPQA